jgi:hypothetical protein
MPIPELGVTLTNDGVNVIGVRLL